jgi:hypothetical protein
MDIEDSLSLAEQQRSEPSAKLALLSMKGSRPVLQPDAYRNGNQGGHHADANAHCRPRFDSPRLLIFPIVNNKGHWFSS